MQTEGNSKDISENTMVRKAAKKVHAAEEVVVRAETAVRIAVCAEISKAPDDAAKVAKEAQSELKNMETKVNALTNKANEANIVANQHLVEAAASKGDDAATKLLTQTLRMRAEKDAYSAAMAYGQGRRAGGLLVRRN